MPHYACPHCGQTQISALQKLWSGSASPAKCASCGGLSYVRTHWQVNLFVLAGYCVALAALGVFIRFGAHLGVLAFAIAASASGYVVSFHLEPMQPTSAQVVAETRPYALGAVAAFLALVCIAAYFR